MGTVARLLAEHVTLRLRAVDRIGVAGYVPALQHEGGLVQFLLHRAALVGRRNIPSPALLGHNHDRMVKDLDRFTAEHGLPVLRFRRGDGKEQLARPYQLAAAAEDRPGVVLVGKAQERSDVWRGWIDKSSPRSTPGHPHVSFGRQSAVPDYWYFYLWDRDWGPALIKLGTYAPYGLWVMANVHEWAKRQLAAANVGFAELDNGLWPTRLAARVVVPVLSDLAATSPPTRRAPHPSWPPGTPTTANSANSSRTSQPQPDPGAGAAHRPHRPRHQPTATPPRPRRAANSPHAHRSSFSSLALTRLGPWKT